jgi:hypothetical protein
MEEAMFDRSSMGAAAMVVALCAVISDARAQLDSKYPDWSGQWVRIGHGSFDPAKPPGRGQQAPLTPEYQAVFEASLADQAKGGQGNDPTIVCIPGGMPRAMIVTQPMEIVITPKTTYVMLELHGQLRRIYTDGRDWPKNIKPSFAGYSIGQWRDEDGDGRFDTLVVETRGFRGPRTFDGTPGTPLHKDNKTVVNERIYLNKTDPTVLHADISVTDNALTRPWSVSRRYKRSPDPVWAEYVCGEGNQQLVVGKENYMISADGFLMPVRKDQAAPDLRYFNQPR